MDRDFLYSDLFDLDFKNYTDTEIAEDALADAFNSLKSLVDSALGSIRRRTPDGIDIGLEMLASVMEAHLSKSLRPEALGDYFIVDHFPSMVEKICSIGQTGRAFSRQIYRLQRMALKIVLEEISGASYEKSNALLNALRNLTRVTSYQYDATAHNILSSVYSTARDFFVSRKSSFLSFFESKQVYDPAFFSQRQPYHAGSGYQDRAGRSSKARKIMVDHFDSEKFFAEKMGDHSEEIVINKEDKKTSLAFLLVLDKAVNKSLLNILLDELAKVRDDVYGADVSPPGEIDIKKERKKHVNLKIFRRIYLVIYILHNIKWYLKHQILADYTNSFFRAVGDTLRAIYKCPVFSIDEGDEFRVLFRIYDMLVDIAALVMGRVEATKATDTLILENSFRAFYSKNNEYRDVPELRSIVNNLLLTLYKKNKECERKLSRDQGRLNLTSRARRETQQIIKNREAIVLKMLDRSNLLDQEIESMNPLTWKTIIPLLKLLGKNKRIKKHHVEKICQHLAPDGGKLDPSMDRALRNNLFKALSLVIEYVDVDVIQMAEARLSKMLEGRLNFSTVEVVFSFTKSIIRSSAFKKNPDIAKYGLEKLWELVTDESAESKNLATRAMTCIKDLLRYGGPALLEKYQQMIFDNIRQHKSVSTSFALIFEIMKGSGKSYDEQIKTLNKKYGLLKLALEDIQWYKERAREASKDLDYNTDISSVIVFGNRPHYKTLKKKLDFLDFILTHSSLTLEIEQFESLWTQFIDNGLYYLEPSLLLGWLETCNLYDEKGKHPVFKTSVAFDIYDRYISKMKVRCLNTPVGFSVLRRFFEFVNYKNKVFIKEDIVKVKKTYVMPKKTYTSSFGGVSSNQHPKVKKVKTKVETGRLILSKEKYLSDPGVFWRILVDDDFKPEIVNLATDYLTSLYFHLDPSMDEESRHRLYETFVEKVKSILEENKTNGSINALRCLLKFINTYDESRDLSLVRDPSLKRQIDLVNSHTILVRFMVTKLSEKSREKYLSIEYQPKPEIEEVQINVRYRNDSRLYDIIKDLEKRAELSSENSYSVFHNNKEISWSYMAERLLSDLATGKRILLDVVEDGVKTDILGRYRNPNQRVSSKDINPKKIKKKREKERSIRKKKLDKAFKKVNKRSAALTVMKYEGMVDRICGVLFDDEASKVLKRQALEVMNVLPVISERLAVVEKLEGDFDGLIGKCSDHISFSLYFSYVIISSKYEASEIFSLDKELLEDNREFLRIPWVESFSEKGGVEYFLRTVYELWESEGLSDDYLGFFDHVMRHLFYMMKNSERTLGKFKQRISSMADYYSDYAADLLDLSLKVEDNTSVSAAFLGTSFGLVKSLLGDESVLKLFKEKKLGKIDTKTIVQKHLLRGSVSRNKGLVQNLLLAIHTEPEEIDSLITVLLSLLDEARGNTKNSREFFEMLIRVLYHSESQILEEFPSLFRDSLEFLERCPVREETAAPESTDYGLYGYLKLSKFLFDQGSDSALDVVREMDFHSTLFDKFLFYVQTDTDDRNPDNYPKCKTNHSRSAAFSFLESIIAKSAEIRAEILAKVHNVVANTDYSRKWNIGHTPTPESSAPQKGKYVGLVNLGATCYLNSSIQQLFAVEELRKNILDFDLFKEKNIAQRIIKAREEKLGVKIDPESVDPSEFTRQEVEEVLTDNEKVLEQFQILFSYLSASEMPYYNAKDFVSSIKDFDGQPLNPHVQRDANEFLNLLFDRLEDALKGTRLESLFSDIFGGTLVHQIICENNHVSERTEPLYTLGLEVKNVRTLEESLQRFVVGDELVGENQYECSVCAKKVDAVKRVCLKTLPNTLFIQLKRFELNYHTMQQEKIDTFLEFPRELDLYAYTDEGLAKVEMKKDEHDSDQEGGDEEASEDVDDGSNSFMSDEDSERRSIGDGGEDSERDASEGGGDDSENDGDDSEKDGDDSEKVGENSEKDRDLYRYVLSGVVIHSGTMNFGHYWSLIKEDSTGKWYEYNDTSVYPRPEEILEKQGFGSTDGNSPGAKGNRKRYSAYLLVYKRVKKVDGDKVYPPRVDDSGAVEFTNLNIMDRIRAENVALQKEKLIFDEPFLNFLVRAFSLEADDNGERFLQLFRLYSDIFLHSKYEKSVVDCANLLLSRLTKERAKQIISYALEQNCRSLTDWLVNQPVSSNAMTTLTLLTKSCELLVADERPLYGDVVTDENGNVVSFESSILNLAYRSAFLIRASARKNFKVANLLDLLTRLLCSEKEVEWALDIGFLEFFRSLYEDVFLWQLSSIKSRSDGAAGMSKKEMEESVIRDWSGIVGILYKLLYHVSFCECPTPGKRSLNLEGFQKFYGVFRHIITEEISVTTARKMMAVLSGRNTEIGKFFIDTLISNIDRSSKAAREYSCIVHIRSLFFLLENVENHRDVYVEYALGGEDSKTGIYKLILDLLMLFSKDRESAYRRRLVRILDALQKTRSRSRLLDEFVVRNFDKLFEVGMHVEYELTREVEPASAGSEESASGAEDGSADEETKEGSGSETNESASGAEDGSAGKETKEGSGSETEETKEGSED